MTKKQKLAALFGKMAAASAISLLAFFAGSTTTYAANYDLYIGSTQVTDANAGDIFGNGTASYDVGTKTLTLNGVHISADNYYEYLKSEYSREKNAVNRYSLYAGTDVVKHLVINGENSFESAIADVLYTFDAAEVDENYWAVDVTGDGEITLDDAKVETEIGNNGIYFSVSGPSSAAQLWTDHSLMITGTGTLTSKATTPTLPDKCRVYDAYGFDSHDVVPVPPDNTVNTGTAMTVEGGGGIYMGNTDGTGPTLKLTGWNKGANFYNKNGRFVMQGGTIIAEAKEPTEGIGVALPAGSEGASYFEGGTIAGYGIYAGDQKGGAFSSPGSKNFDQPNAQTHKMQRVYPAAEDGDTRPIKIEEISGWAVVGMTADGFKADTDAVMETLRTEYGLGSSGGGEEPGTDPVDKTEPVAGTNGKYHTDTVPDPGVTIDVQGFTKDATIYSVDVEWGAMTFRYEKSSWDAVEHKVKPGAGWQLYDTANDKVIGDTQNTINQVTVTNHSNAGVYATLSYAGTDGYTDITGGFTKKTDDAATDFTAASDGLPDYLTLGTADNGTGDAAGTPTAGNVYFMPANPASGSTVNDIAKWQKIGKITVGILTEQPTASP